MAIGARESDDGLPICQFKLNPAVIDGKKVSSCRAPAPKLTLAERVAWQVFTVSPWDTTSGLNGEHKKNLKWEGVESVLRFFSVRPNDYLFEMLLTLQQEALKWQSRKNQFNAESEPDKKENAG